MYFLWFLFIFSYLFGDISSRKGSYYQNYEETSSKNSNTRLDLDLDAAIRRFSKAITFETVSMDPGVSNVTELTKFKKHLEASYPLIHSTPWIERTIVGSLSIVYTIKSLNHDKNDFTKKPWILQSHQDVAPVFDLHKWDAPPFSGQVLYDPKTNKRNIKFTIDDANNEKYYVYGRGTADAKHIVMSIMEAVEYMIGKGLRPIHKTLILSFGHDEEVGGFYGARKVAHLIVNTYPYPPNGGKPIDFILDEGFTIVKDVLPQNKKMALVSVSEKYVMDVNMSVVTPGGHSSLPTKENAISILSNAVVNIDTNQFASYLAKPGTPDAELLRRIAYLFPQPYRLYMEHATLYRDKLINMTWDNDLINALTRTTEAVTLFNGGIKYNVIPNYAESNVNYRVHPLQEPEEVLEYAAHTINDPRVNIQLDTMSPRSPISDYDTDAFRIIESTIHDMFNETIVVPTILVGGTDSKHFANIVDNAYRFSPLTIVMDDMSRIHGINERISVADFYNCVKYYFNLIEKVSGFKMVSN
ncbi:unnamed protein product [Gordionus sp. m RMFG-2023]